MKACFGCRDRKQRNLTNPLKCVYALHNSCICAAKQSVQIIEVALRMLLKMLFPSLVLCAYGPSEELHGVFRRHIGSLPKFCQRQGTLTIALIQQLSFWNIDFVHHGTNTLECLRDTLQ